ncbi:hypothetical protein PHJA_002128200 [Phtheirospermum japonicum]|uniref:Late embryogenesis abundant protein LEA-2 subgroup domain-containing protein n=1 Tax=Phtheirospermum japonicum TaxID=374723 RepID=A0A830D0F1_9LAMI|nr:hypothetical protein PHJA_002128200 [Phtheirospermum japonicum]
MEERLPPPPPTKRNPLLPLPPAAAQVASGLETYVVQIPRDQIYRVPPPEHARIVESYHNRNARNPVTNRRKTFCWATSVPVVLVVVAVIAVFSIRATLYYPTPPAFTVARIQAKNLEHASKDHRRSEFDVILRAENPNKRLSVSYQGGSGETSLVYKNIKIGQGTFRSQIKQEPGGGGDDFQVVLAGNVAALSLEIEKILNGSTEKLMALMMEVTIDMNSWVRNERKNIKISCDFRVKNSLTKKNKISFQECRTEF